MGMGIRGGAVRQIQALLDSGSLGALDDGELLGRFLGRGPSADPAFAALVARHGRMVHRVCLQILGDGHDAQDAAQATFLVLARRAATIRRPEALAAWLHGAARRIAARALRDATRRRRHERRRGEGPIGTPGPPRDWSDLHEELDRLPARYREPIVLCDLAGLSHDQAASQLGAPVRTLQTRLYRGREQLKGRLIRRGLAPSAALVGLAWASGSRASTGPAWPPAAGSIPPGPAATLARSYLKETLMAKLKGVAAAGLLAGVAAGGAWSLGAAGGDGPRQAPTAESRAQAVGGASADAFERAYALADGEVLKCIRGPKTRARADHFRDKAGEIGVGQGSINDRDPLGVGFEWDAGRRGWASTSCPGPVDLRAASATILGLRELEVEGDPKLLETSLLFDFVVRKDAPIEQRAEAWQAALGRDFGVPARLTLATERRDVIVVRGRFPTIAEILVPAGAPEREMDLPTIEVFTTKVGRPGMANFSDNGGIFAGFLRSLERETGRRFANEVAGIPDGSIRWHVTGGAARTLGAEDRALMLGNLTAQTGLTFWEEPRDVTILKVERIE